MKEASIVESIRWFGIGIFLASACKIAGLVTYPTWVTLMFIAIALFNLGFLAALIYRGPQDAKRPNSTAEK